jgi:hypothetical protein
MTLEASHGLTAGATTLSPQVPRLDRLDVLPLNELALGSPH